MLVQKNNTTSLCDFSTASPASFFAAQPSGPHTHTPRPANLPFAGASKASPRHLSSFHLVSSPYSFSLPLAFSQPCVVALLRHLSSSLFGFFVQHSTPSQSSLHLTNPTARFVTFEFKCNAPPVSQSSSGIRSPFSPSLETPVSSSPVLHRCVPFKTTSPAHRVNST